MVEEAILIRSDDTIRLKKAISKCLYKKNIDQVRISKILNLSQPMVSNYLNSKEIIPKHILDLADVFSKKIIDAKSASFHTCISFNDELFEGRFFIAKNNEIINDEKVKIIDNLTEAFLILKGQNLKTILPEIKINIAMAKHHAENSDDVASFLNGLIIADDRVTSNNGIHFGKSKHLSSILLYLKNRLGINAIMNIAYVEDLKEADFTYSYLTKNFKLKDKNQHFDILFHEGDFGIEPCTYILGKDAVDVANKIIRIKEVIK